MKVVVFGAGGTLGTRITDELVRRNHTVKEVARAGKKPGTPRPRTSIVIADVTDAASVAAAVRGADAVVSAIGPGAARRPAQVRGPSIDRRRWGG